MKDMLPSTKPASWQWISWEAAMLPEEATWLLGRELQRLEKKVNKLKLRWTSSASQSQSPFNIFTRVKCSRDCGFVLGSVSLYWHSVFTGFVGTGIHRRWTYCISIHWIVYFMYLYLHTQYSFYPQKYRLFMFFLNLLDESMTLFSGNFEFALSIHLYLLGCKVTNGTSLVPFGLDF